MNKEKLEKASWEHAEEPSLQSSTFMMRKSSFERGVNWLMQQPLSDRLTDEEKERIRAMYQKAIKEIDDMGLPREYSGTYRVVTEIFGKELFNEK